MIVPSSNTVLEEELARLVPPGGPVAVHVTRVRVTEISLASDALAQFDATPMTNAAELLGDARVDAVAWGGTAGSWLGIAHDRALVASLERAAGVPATTSMLALLQASLEQGIERIGLLTPYTADVVERVIPTLAAQGVSVAAERHSGLTVNHSFATVGPDELVQMATACAESASLQAFMVLCTNLRGGGPVAARITKATGLPVLDSCEVTLAAAVAAAGKAPPTGHTSHLSPTIGDS